MSNKKELSPEEIAALQKELAEAKALAKKNAAIEKELEAAKSELAEAKESLEEAGKTGRVSPKIPGSCAVSWTTPTGDEKKLKIRFCDGRVHTYIDGLLFPSAAVMRIATGGKAREEEVKVNPNLAGLKKDKALAHLTWLAKIRSNTVEEAK